MIHPAPPVSQRRRLLYIVMPLLLLLALLGAINLLPGSKTAVLPPTALPITPTSRVEAIVLEPTVLVKTAVATTPTTTPNATATPLSTQIELLGPPPDSSFPAAAQITLYWRWPLPLQPEQQFAVYLQDDDGDHLLGTVAEPNLGTLYQLQARLPNVGKTAVWFIQLQDNATNRRLQESTPRPITIIPSE